MIRRICAFSVLVIAAAGLAGCSQTSHHAAISGPATTQTNAAGQPSRVCGDSLGNMIFRSNPEFAAVPTGD